MALDRNTLRYQSRRSDNPGLRARIREIAESKRRYGCPRIYVRLRREGWRVNHKKVERIYREEGLSLRRRARKKVTAVPRVALPRPSEPGRCYAMDFVHDRLASGRRFKCLTMTDLCSKEVPVIEVDVRAARHLALYVRRKYFNGVFQCIGRTESYFWFHFFCGGYVRLPMRRHRRKSTTRAT